MQFLPTTPTIDCIRMPSFFETLFQQEYNELKNKCYNINSEDITVHYQNKLVSSKYVESLGSIITPINYNTVEVQKLVRAYSYADPNLQICTKADVLLKNVTDKIIMLDGEFTFEEALAIGEQWISALGQHFYGMMLRNGDTLFNPYHPITAVVASTEPFTKKYKIVIYPYSDREHYDLTSLSALIPSEKVTPMITNLLTALTGEIAQERKSFVTLNILDRFANASFAQISGYFAPIQYTASRASTEGRDLSKKECMLTTHQVLANGVAAPYYGTSLLLRDNARTHCKGLHLGMCRSVNISSNYKDYYDTVTLGSVCVGSTDGYSDQSLATLNHANLGSPHQRFSIAPGITHYIDQCVYFSRQIYKSAGLITTELNEMPIYVPDYKVLDDVYTKLMEETRTDSLMERIGWSDPIKTYITNYLSTRKSESERITE